MDFTKQPFVVEFAGLPAAGKTTTTNLLGERLRSRGIRVAIVSEAAANSPLGKLKRDWHFNAWTLCHTTERLLEAYAEEAVQAIILDRGLVDAFCWIEWFKANDEIPNETASVLQAFAMLRDWVVHPHVTFCLSTRFETALKRRGHAGRILNPKTYSELERAYQKGVHSLAVQERQSVESISTDGLSPNEVLERVAHSLEQRFGNSRY